jgi:hypothetical protein
MYHTWGMENCKLQKETEGESDVSLYLSENSSYGYWIWEYGMYTSGARQGLVVGCHE